MTTLHAAWDTVNWILVGLCVGTSLFAFNTRPGEIALGWLLAVTTASHTAIWIVWGRAIDSILGAVFGVALFTFTLTQVFKGDDD